MDIYTQCPRYENELLFLRQTRVEDALQLAKIYADKESRKLFNMDNFAQPCFFETEEEMRREICFYNASYQARDFVRWSVFLKENKELIASVECFARESDGVFPRAGILRMDIKSEWEMESILVSIMELMILHAYEDFHVDLIATKVVPDAQLRQSVLQKMGFLFSEQQPMDHQGNRLKDYMIR